MLQDISANVVTADVVERNDFANMCALQSAMALSGEHERTIVTLRDAEEIVVDEGPIRVAPAWQWLLG